MERDRMSQLPIEDPRHALSIVPGVGLGHDGLPAGTRGGMPATPHPPRRTVPVAELADGVLAGDRVALARAITLVESNAPAHFQRAQDLLTRILPHAGGSVRIGITGVPGAGKSTLIETLGMELVGRGLKLAVTAVDPSSTVTGGSILGDKTRMERLATHPSAFIRPSPSGGTLGGVARKTRETILLFEAAGYGVVFVETVGVGQSEVTVRSMVDFFLLVLAPGAGDELQGIKKGVVELADTVLINKADGANRIPALTARSEYERALHYIQPSTEGWNTPALAASATTGEGLAELWDTVQAYLDHARGRGLFVARRREQERAWLRAMVEERLRERFFSHPRVRGLIPDLDRAVTEGTLPVASAAARLLEAFDSP
jgi:LAO/AO transport system kinase